MIDDANEKHNVIHNLLRHMNKLIFHTWQISLLGDEVFSLDIS